MSYDASKEPVVYFNHDQRKALSENGRKLITSTVLAGIDWSGAEEQTIDFRGFDVCVRIQSRPAASHKGWADVESFRCRTSKLFVLAPVHVRCGKACNHE